MTTYSWPSGSPVCTQYGRPETSTTACTSASSSGTVRVAEAADAGLVAERLAQGLAEHDRGVLDGVVGVDVGVALGLHGQVDQRVPGERGRACGRRSRRRCETSARPVPSRSSSTMDLGLLGLALALPSRWRLIGGSSVVLTVRGQCASRNAVISSAVPTETRSQPSGPVSRISTPRSSSALPDGVPVGEPAEEHEVGVAVGDRRAPARAARRRSRRARRADRSTSAEQLVGVPQRGERDRLGDRAKVVGQPHQPERVDRSPGSAAR